MVDPHPHPEEGQCGPEVVPSCSPSPSTRIRAMAHSVTRSTILAGLLASAIIALAGPAEAKGKKAEPAAAADESATAGEGGGEEKKAGPPASQAGDVERPKPILNEEAAESGPKADEK